MLRRLLRRLVRWHLLQPVLAWLWAPCIMTAYGTQVRDGVKRKYGLPDDEVCGTTTCPRTSPPTSVSTRADHLPESHAVRRLQMYFMRYTRKGPAPSARATVLLRPLLAAGRRRGGDKYQRVTRKVGKTLREADHHAMEDLTTTFITTSDGDPFKNQNTKDDAVTTAQPT